MPLKPLRDYLSRYGGIGDWHLQAFRVINNSFSPEKVLYPGSWIHLTPSLVFPRVVYVDLSLNMQRTLSSPDLLHYIEDHAEYQGKPKIKFYQSNYRSNFGEEKASFDLLISLSSGLVSQACAQYLKKGAVLFANNEHYDACMAYADPRLKPIGVFKTAGKYIESEESIQSYFITTKGEPISLEMVDENTKRPPSKAIYKLKRKALFYTFQKIYER